MSESPSLTLSSHPLPEETELSEESLAPVLHRAQDSHVVYRPLSAAPKEVLDFSSFSSPQLVSRLCVERVPGWYSVDAAELRVSQLCEGLSNQIFKVSLPSVGAGSPISQRSAALKGFNTNNASSQGGSNSFSYTTVLFRVHGKDSEALYDQKEELKIFKTLSKYQIGPQLIANGDGWRIEEWHYSVPIPVKALPNPSIFGQVASALGRFHRLHKRKDFPSDLSREPITLMRLEKWAQNAGKAAGPTGTVTGQKGVVDVDGMLKEAEWLKTYLIEQGNNRSNKFAGSGYDVVFSHNDCQENNLLQTPYGLRMIDFEYAGFNYQAYDIANFFCEFTMDYTEKNYPFYATNLAAYPDRQSQELFASIYLSEYLENPILPTDSKYIAPLLQTVEIFALASHLLWALWSVIRAPQSPTFDQFDFLDYANFRFNCYKRAKRALSLQASSQPPAYPTSHVLATAAAILGASALARSVFYSK